MNLFYKLFGKFNKRNRKLFLEAVEKGNIEIAEKLIEKGVDVNVITANGNTALNLALYKGYIKIAKMLIEKGADVNVINVYGDTALMLASGRGHIEIVNMLIERSNDINAAKQNGYTALMLASDRGYIEILKILIDHGANVNTATKSGKTALNLAFGRGHKEIIEILIDNGANLNDANNKACIKTSSEDKSAPTTKSQIVMEENNDGINELDIIVEQLNSSLDRYSFRRHIQNIGFTFVKEDVVGEFYESNKGALVFSVYESQHPSDIADLMYASKDKSVYIPVVENHKIIIK